MPVHNVMSRNGHDQFAFDKSDKMSVAEAEKRFNELVGTKKFMAIEPGKNGEPGRLLKAFDPDVEETLFQPSLQGG